ncbi:MAG: ankyrin repeat domain-containing protein [Gammaproteobacteria bacterium]
MKSHSFTELYDYVCGDRAAPDTFKQRSKTSPENKIKKFFFEEKKPLIKNEDRNRFIQALKKLHSFNLEKQLTQDQPILDEKANYDFPDEKSIQSNFDELENQYHFFNPEERETALAKFREYFILSKLIADFIEFNNTEGDKRAYLHAYKLLVVFGDLGGKNLFEDFDKYVIEHNLRKNETSLQTALLHSLPNNNPDQPIDLPQWQRLIRQAGPRSFHLFRRAAEIEAKLKRAPKDLKEALKISKSIKYKNADIDPELSDLCMLYDLDETIFERCLELKKQQKKSDNLPNTVIDGSIIKKPGYYLVKLPPNDPRAFILGYITNCCQSIGRDSEQCVIDGITRANNGFYLLLKENKKQRKSKDKKQPIHPDGSINYKDFKIVGQSYGWLSEDDNFTFDSWENLHKADDPVITALLRIFGKEIIQKHPSILRVTIGINRKTPIEFRKKINYPEKIKEGHHYSDSKVQGLIYINEERQQQLLESLQQQLRHIIENEIKETFTPSLIRKEDITSIAYADMIKSVLQNAAFQHFLQNENNRITLQKAVKCQHIANELGYSVPSVWQELHDHLHRPKPHKSAHNSAHNEIEYMVSNLIAKFNLNINFFISEATRKNRLDLLEALANEKKSSLDDSRSLIDADSVEVVKILLNNKADINVTDGQGNTLLHKMIMRKKLDIAKTLIDASANIEIKNQFGFTPIFVAVSLGNIDSLKLLLAARADISAANNLGNTVLHFAVGIKHNSEILKLLLNANAKIHVKNIKGLSPFQLACQNKLFDTAGRLFFKDVSALHISELKDSIDKLPSIAEGENVILNIEKFKRDISEIFFSNEDLYAKFFKMTMKLQECLDSIVTNPQFDALDFQRNNHSQNEICQALFQLFKNIHTELARESLSLDNLNIFDKNFPRYSRT